MTEIQRKYLHAFLLLILLQREMDVRGLESHAEELKAKALNPRGTLRKLFIKYCQAKEFNKALKVKEEFEENHGELSVGMQSALLGLYVQRGQLKLALELYENLKTASTDLETHERWKLDCFKIYDLATLMVESQMVDRKLNICYFLNCISYASLLGWALISKYL
jgi:hypothetical protein